LMMMNTKSAGASLKAENWATWAEHR
jgi:hypothetical protein